LRKKDAGQLSAAVFFETDVNTLSFEGRVVCLESAPVLRMDVIEADHAPILHIHIKNVLRQRMPIIAPFDPPIPENIRGG
jgi:hypothetical protein